MHAKRPARGKGGKSVSCFIFFFFLAFALLQCGGRKGSERKENLKTEPGAGACPSLNLCSLCSRPHIFLESGTQAKTLECEKGRKGIGGDDIDFRTGAAVEEATLCRSSGKGMPEDFYRLKFYGQNLID